MFWSVCSSLFVQVCSFKSVRSSLFVQVCLLESVYSRLYYTTFRQTCQYFSVSGKDFSTPLCAINLGQPFVNSVRRQKSTASTWQGKCSDKGGLYALVTYILVLGQMDKYIYIYSCCPCPKLASTAFFCLKPLFCLADWQRPEKYENRGKVFASDAVKEKKSVIYRFFSAKHLTNDLKCGIMILLDVSEQINL